MPALTWPERLAAWIDSMIEPFAPEWAARRKAYRSVIEFSHDHLSGFNGSGRFRGDKFDRLSPERTSNGSADYFLESNFSRREMVRRSRALERDNPLASWLLTAAADNVVGTGIRPQSLADREWAETAEQLFTDWAEKEADARGLETLWSLQSLWYRSSKRDGDVGVALLSDFTLQSFESDQIAAPLGEEFRGNQADGVEIDSVGRPVAFHVVQDDRAIEKISGERQSRPDRRRIPSSSFLYGANRERLGQTRGLPCFARSFWLFDHMTGVIEATTVAARMAACFGLIFKTNLDPTGGLPKAKAGNGANLPQMDLEPGFNYRLQPGEDVQQIDPKHPSSNLNEFIRLLARFVSLDIGLPLQIGLLDFDRSNFSADRSAVNQAQRIWRCEQHKFARWALQPIWEWRIQGFIEEGLLQDREDKFRVNWVPSGWAYLDPQKEAMGQLLALDMGVTTRREIAAQQGRDIDAVITQLGREQEQLTEAGLTPFASTMTRHPDAGAPAVSAGGVE